MSDGASATSLASWMRGEMAMLAKGLATTVFTWVLVETTSSSPGTTAVPPVSRMCSTEL